MEFAKGVTIPFPEKIKPEYQMCNNFIIMNPDINNLYDLLNDFLISMKIPLVFFIELPCTIAEEDELRKSDTDAFHQNLYYLKIDDLDTCKRMLSEYKELLLHDGGVRYGFLSHNSDEIYVYRYKVTYIKGKKLKSFKPLLKKYGYKEVKNLITPPSTFSYENPGTSKKIIVNGKDVYTMRDELMEKGMYFAHTVPQ